MNREEQALHKAIAEYLDWCLIPPAWYTTIPAGGGGKVRGAILKGMGYKAGTPDILLIHSGRAYWLEVKTPEGRMSDAQATTRVLLQMADCSCEVVRFLADVRWVLRAWGIPTRVSR